MTRSILYLITVLIIVITAACADEKVAGTYELAFDTDLIPEGIAFDPMTKKVYLNSLKDNKILRSNLDGSNIEIVVSSGQHNYQSGFGMTIKDNILYALGNGLPKNDNTSILLLINTDNNELVKSYTLDDTTHTYLNDLAVSSEGGIYITDSKSKSIYTVNQHSEKLEVFIKNEALPYSNGIAISNDDNLLYLATWEGIKIVDLKTKKIVNGINEDNQGIDGLKYYNNTLIGIINVWEKNSVRNGMYQWQLSEDGRSITSRKKIVPFDQNFATPTTLALCDGHACFIMNTHLDYFDGDNNTITKPDSLKAYRLMIHEL